MTNDDDWRTGDKWTSLMRRTLEQVGNEGHNLGRGKTSRGHDIQVCPGLQDRSWCWVERGGNQSQRAPVPCLWPICKPGKALHPSRTQFLFSYFGNEMLPSKHFSKMSLSEASNSTPEGSGTGILLGLTRGRKEKRLRI